MTMEYEDRQDEIQDYRRETTCSPNGNNSSKKIHQKSNTSAPTKSNYLRKDNNYFIENYRQDDEYLVQKFQEFKERKQHQRDQEQQKLQQLQLSIPFTLPPNENPFGPFDPHVLHLQPPSHPQQRELAEEDLTETWSTWDPVQVLMPSRSERRLRRQQKQRQHHMHHQDKQHQKRDDQRERQDPTLKVVKAVKSKELGESGDPCLSQGVVTKVRETIHEEGEEQERSRHSRSYKNRRLSSQLSSPSRGPSNCGNDKYCSPLQQQQQQSPSIGMMQMMKTSPAPTPEHSSNNLPSVSKAKSSPSTENSKPQASSSSFSKPVDAVKNQSVQCHSKRTESEKQVESREKPFVLKAQDLPATRYQSIGRTSSRGRTRPSLKEDSRGANNSSFGRQSQGNPSPGRQRSLSCGRQRQQLKLHQHQDVEQTKQLNQQKEELEVCNADQEDLQLKLSNSRDPLFSADRRRKDAPSAVILGKTEIPLSKSRSAIRRRSCQSSGDISKSRSWSRALQYQMQQEEQSSLTNRSCSILGFHRDRGSSSSCKNASDRSNASNPSILRRLTGGWGRYSALAETSGPVPEDQYSLSKQASAIPFIQHDSVEVVMESPQVAMAAALADARVPHGFVIIEDETGESPTRVVMSTGKSSGFSTT